MLAGTLVFLSVPCVWASNDVGPLVRALWLVQSYGTVYGSDPANDVLVKRQLAKAIAMDGELTLVELDGLMDPATFHRLAGPDGRIAPLEIERALVTINPESRRRLCNKVREHADYLTTTFDLINETHRRAGQELGDWIIKNYKPGEPLHIIIVCTGNSRRSMLGAMMGNLAAAYYGMPEIRFSSGGTAPTAFNPRTIATLQAIGFEIEATGVGAERGAPDLENPIYRVSWGDDLAAQEFSKHYAHSSNPQSGFAALLVCHEADAECPAVKGASLRLSMPYEDPKIYDGGSLESAKYAERRDDMGRLMLAVLARVRQQLTTNSPVP